MLLCDIIIYVVYDITVILPSYYCRAISWVFSSWVFANWVFTTLGIRDNEYILRESFDIGWSHVRKDAQYTDILRLNG